MEYSSQLARTGSVTALNMHAGDRVYSVEIVEASESLLLRIPECDILDLLPLSPPAADRLLESLQVTVDRGEWMSFLTKPDSAGRRGQQS